MVREKAALSIGLTGGIGSGKSTVSEMLASLGAAIIDADALSRQCSAAGGAAIEPIREKFGDAFIDASGALDRAKMRETIFSDPQARARLEAIVHPLVGQAIEQRRLAAQRSGTKLIVFDVPLLVEGLAQWRGRVDQILVVDCPESTQIERVEARSGLRRAQIEQIIASQASRAERLAAADHVIDNGAQTTLEGLARQVRQLVEKLAAL